MSQTTRSVFVAIVGRPNVGKSSLLNRLIGEKAAIVSPKPQTTRTRITGILTKDALQYVFIDTPGIHIPRTKLGQHMTKTATDSVGEGDVVLMLFEPEEPLRPVELEIIESLKKNSAAIAVINKADTIKAGQVLMEKASELKNFDVFRDVKVVSAETGEGCEELLGYLGQFALEGPHYFPDDVFTDQPEKEIAAEIVREKLLLHMQEEIPHGTAVEVDRFKERPSADIIDIDVVIYCEKKSHKGMIIGKGGQMLKKVASEARADMEQLLGTKVNLQCWVKIKENWRDSETMLRRMGFK